MSRSEMFRSSEQTMRISRATSAEGMVQGPSPVSRPTENQRTLSQTPDVSKASGSQATNPEQGKGFLTNVTRTVGKGVEKGFDVVVKLYKGDPDGPIPPVTF